MINFLKKHKFIYVILFFASLVIGSTLLLINAQDEKGKINVNKSATKVYEGASEDNLEKGRFANVNLSVSANSFDIEAKNKLDIVLVIDNSSSMDKTDANNSNTQSRRQAAKAAATDFVDSLINGDKDNVKIGVVVFGTDLQNSQSLSNNATTIKNFINGINSVSNQGTNVQSAIAQAESLLSEGREDAKKVVVILTDGEPTYFNYTYTYYNRNGNLVTNTSRAGNGSNNNAVNVCYAYNRYYRCTDSRSVKPSDAAKAALDSLKRTYSNSDVYTIGFGNEAGNSLSIINPASNDGENPIYQNLDALTGDQLKEKFHGISDKLVELIGRDSVVTDIIPKEFKLTQESKTELEEKGITVVSNEDGTTTLTWNIGNISAGTEYNISYIVRAEDDYHGSIYTNDSATLITTVDDDNPYYKDMENKTITLEFEKPSAEIPMITNDDHYNDNSSYIGYAQSIINGASILNNDLNENVKTDGNNATVEDKIIINENDNTRKISNDTYEIYKNNVKQGKLTINSDGTFVFISEENISGEVEFTYHVETTINPYEETNTVISNDSKVTLNILERSKVSINGIKVWDDNNNQDGLRPENITIGLYANGVPILNKQLTSSNWAYSFTDLYKYQAGHENEERYLINYEVKELTKVDGYFTTYGNNSIINTHVPEKTEVSVSKVWNDNDDQDGLRDEVVVVLKADDDVAKRATLNEDNDWEYTFENLPKYKAGEKIVYSIEEIEIKGYTSRITGTAEEGFTITNTHTPEVTEVVGRKVWQDKNDQDGLRPESITVKLFAGGEYVTEGTFTEGENKNWAFAFTNLPKYKDGAEIEYTIEEVTVGGYTPSYGENNTIINTHETSKIVVSGTKTWDDNDDQDGLRPDSIIVRLIADGEEIAYKEVTETDQWSYSFTGLDEYANGSKISYTITEDAVSGYTTVIDGYNITNTHVPEKISISGTKTWDDNGDQDGLRPDSITVRLIANGEEIAYKEVTQADNWSYSFTDLDKCANGEEIDYVIKEDTVEGYTNDVTNYNITNTHQVEKITFKATKVWDDNNNQDGLRPNEIIVSLYKNGEPYKKVSINETNGWTYIFESLDRYSSGEEIIYTIVEEEIPGYQTIIDYDEIDKNNIISSTITNTHAPEKIDIDINKTWDDEDNYDQLRPNEILVDIYKDGIIYNTITITQQDDWKYVIKDLDKYNKGKEILYTIFEHPVDGYNTKINLFDITNTHEVIMGVGKGYEEDIIPAPNTGIDDTVNNKNLDIFKVILVLLSLLLGLKKVSIND